MYSVQFLKFLVSRDAEDFISDEKTEKQSDENVIYRHSRYATIPIEIKKSNI
jgi:hypothetical protein